MLAECAEPKPKYFISQHVPEGMRLDELNSAKQQLSMDELRRIFRNEIVLFPNGTNLADLQFLKMRHDLNARHQYTYDPRQLKPGHLDRLIVIRLGDPLQAVCYTGFKSPVLEHDPCVM